MGKIPGSYPDKSVVRPAGFLIGLRIKLREKQPLTDAKSSDIWKWLESENMMFGIVTDAISGVRRIPRAGIQPSLLTLTCIRIICKSERN